MWLCSEDFTGERGSERLLKAVVPHGILISSVPYFS